MIDSIDLLYICFHSYSLLFEKHRSVILIIAIKEEEEVNECFAAFSEMSNVTITTMIMSTGKGINDLGDPDACNMNPETVHVNLNIKGLPANLGL